MPKMRAKVRVTSVTPYPQEGTPSQETLYFNFPAKEGAYPADGSDEDQQFARFSPAGSLSLTVANPALIGQFKAGDTFYLDFVPVAVVADPAIAEAPQEHILQFFAYEHLPENLKQVSRPFGDLARSIAGTIPRNAERTVALRKLLEAKDAAVRAQVAK